MPVSKKTERVSARVTAHVYDILTQAAEFTGATLNQFLVQSALEKAQAILERERVIKLTMEDAEIFFEALENPPPPNKKLLNAMKIYEETFLNAEDRSAS